MFKNATIYRISSLPPLAAILEDALQAATFCPCGASQEKSAGWIPPRGHDHGALLESVAGQYVLRLMVESKSVPADVVKRKVAEQVDHIEATTGRKPGKKEKREISDEVRLSLLPMAFTKQVATTVWIDPEAGMVVIDSASQSKADEVVTMLIRAIDGLVIQMMTTILSPASCMAGWLTYQEAPSGFTIDRECELKATDESKAVVKYGRHPLDIAEVAQHIAQGKMPTRLALTYNDRVSFVLTEAGTLKKIGFLESVFESAKAVEHADNFDADVAIATGELKKLIPALMAALGGEPDLT